MIVVLFSLLCATLVIGFEVAGPHKIDVGDKAKFIELCAQQIFKDGPRDPCTTVGLNEYGGCDYKLDTDCIHAESCRKKVAELGDECLRGDSLYDEATDKWSCNVYTDKECEQERQELATIGEFIRKQASSTYQSVGSWFRGLKWPYVLEEKK